MPKLTAGANQNRQLSTDDGDRAAKSQRTHQTATVAVRMNRPNLRKAPQIGLGFVSSARSETQRNQRIAAVGKSRTVYEKIDRFVKLAKMSFLFRCGCDWKCT
jgi:hypothetical protein